MKMTLAKTLLISVVCVMVASAQKPKNMKPGVERWPIKISAHHLNDAPKDVPYDTLIALPDPAGVKKNDPRYQDAFIPAFPNSSGLHEGDIVRVTGWLHLVAFETDGDYHIQVSNSGTSGDRCLIVEVPYPTYVKSAPNLKNLCAAVRASIKNDILSNKEPSTSGTILKQAVHVTITGQLFYDDAHVGTPPRGKKGMKAATLWEVHPVTGIEIIPN